MIFVRFDGGKPSGAPVDVLTGFVDDQGKALGRPVGVAIDKEGRLKGLMTIKDILQRGRFPNGNLPPARVEASGQSRKRG